MGVLTPWGGTLFSLGPVFLVITLGYSAGSLLAAILSVLAGLLITSVARGGKSAATAFDNRWAFY